MLMIIYQKSESVVFAKDMVTNFIRLLFLIIWKWHVDVQLAEKVRYGTLITFLY